MHRVTSKTKEIKRRKKFFSFNSNTHCLSAGIQSCAQYVLGKPGEHSTQEWIGMCCPSRNASNYIFGEFDEFSLNLSNPKYAKIIQISSIHLFSNTCFWIYQSNIFVDLPILPFLPNLLQ